VTDLWKRIEPTKVDKIGRRTVVTKTFAVPDGQVAEFQTIGPEGSHCVAAIALTPAYQVIVARQFRPGPEKVLDGLPGGKMEAADESYEAASRPELLEETGYVPGTMELLGEVYKDSVHNRVWHYFLARECTLSTQGQHLDDDELVEVRLITIDQLFDNARHSRMTDVSAVFLAYERLMNMQG
jgi:ADP-ribose pyrophosphatase